MASRQWKKGTGKLGAMAPLIGMWDTTADSPMGKVKCTRTFEPILDGNYIQLKAHWDFGGNRGYDEMAVFGAEKSGTLTYWSFTSDGGNMTGKQADVSSINPDAIGFESMTPNGPARQAFWSDGENGFHWVVEAKTPAGWSRFTTHHYKPVKS